MHQDWWWAKFRLWESVALEIRRYEIETLAFLGTRDTRVSEGVLNGFDDDPVSVIFWRYTAYMLHMHGFISIILQWVWMCVGCIGSVGRSSYPLCLSVSVLVASGVGLMLLTPCKYSPAISLIWSRRLASISCGEVRLHIVRITIINSLV